MTQKLYLIQWVDLVSRNVSIYADSEEDAIEKFENGEGYEWDEVQEYDAEHHQEPFAELISEEEDD